MRHIAVLFLKGGSSSTAILPAEIFCNAGVFWNLLTSEPVSAPFRVTTASLDGSPVRNSAQVSIAPQCAFEDLDPPDLVFVPASGLEVEELITGRYDIDEGIAPNIEVVDWLRRWAAGGACIAAACTGVALVAEAGLLDGKHGTTHWGLAGQFRTRFPRVDWRAEYMVTDAGDVFCGGGINAAADLALYLVERFSSRDIAAQCAKSLLVEMPRTWQASFTHFPARNSHRDEPILKAQDWLQKNFATDVRFEALAADVGMSSRNFARRFKEATTETPISYLHALRVSMAKRLLETTRMTVQEIASEVGYTDLIFFRRLFKRHTGLSPNDYRKRFGASTAAG